MRLHTQQSPRSPPKSPQGRLHTLPPPNNFSGHLIANFNYQTEEQSFNKMCPQQNRGGLTCVWIKKDASRWDTSCSFKWKQDVAGTAGRDLAPHPILRIGHTARRTSCHAGGQGRALQRRVVAGQRPRGACAAGRLRTWQKDRKQQSSWYPEK